MAWTAVLIAATGCGGGTDVAGVSTVVADGRPTVVATTAILGDLVTGLVGDAATVRVIVPNGQDPHEFATSARDAEALRGADLIVANGLGLEGLLDDAVDAAEGQGVPVFRATEHVTLRIADDAPHSHDDGDEGAGRDAGHDDDGQDGDHDSAGGQDPHVWTSPTTVIEMIAPLASALADATGLDLEQASAQQVETLRALDAEIADTMATIPDGDCVLVTGHDSLGYFAARYGCEVVGTVIPGFSSSAEASAGDLAEMTRAVRDHDVRAVFTEVGTPAAVAERVAAEVGVELVELPTHALPPSGGYAGFVRELARRIVDALDALDAS